MYSKALLLQLNLFSNKLFYFRSFKFLDLRSVQKKGLCQDHPDIHLRVYLSKKINKRMGKNGIDDRCFVHPSGDQIKVMMKTRRSSKEKAPGI